MAETSYPLDGLPSSLATDQLKPIDRTKEDKEDSQFSKELKERMRREQQKKKAAEKEDRVTISDQSGQPGAQPDEYDGSEEQTAAESSETLPDDDDPGGEDSAAGHVDLKA
jgi:hypothetical protein